MFSIVLLGSCQKDIEGCTDATAVNYNPDATIPNSTCQYVPTLTTIPINTNFPPSYNYFTGGIISSDGGSFVTLRGVCYSFNPEPTIDDDKTIDAFTETFEVNLSTFNPLYSIIVDPKQQLTESQNEVELPKILVEKWKKEGRYVREDNELNTFFPEVISPTYDHEVLSISPGISPSL